MTSFRPSEERKTGFDLRFDLFIIFRLFYLRAKLSICQEKQTIKQTKKKI